MRKFKCDYHYVDDLIRRYEEEGGQVICLNDGCLASGEWLLFDDTNKKKLGGLGFDKTQKDGCIARGKGKNVKANRLATEQIIDGYLPIGCAQAAMLTRRAAYDALVDNI